MGSVKLSLPHFLAGAFAYGFLKAGAAKSAVGACQRSPGFGTTVADAAWEEMGWRVGLPAILTGFGVSPGAAGLTSSVAFGLGHVTADMSPGWGGIRFADAALGGLLYTAAFGAHGFLGALATHVAHNLGVYAGGNCGD